MNKPKLIIFDCDGVITETAHLHFQAWKDIAKQKLDIELGKDFLDLFRGLSRIDSVILIMNKFDLKLSELEIEEFIALKNERYLELIADSSNYSAIKNIADLIQQIKQTDIKIALASVSRNAPQLLRALKMFDLFDFIVDPATIVHHKPAPDIFLRAAEHFNYTSKECIGVEDAKIGVQAIRDAKMFSIGIGDANEVGDANLVYSYKDNIKLDDILIAWKK